MKCLIASLCVIALVALPTRASADSGSEVASAKRFVIAYIPEHLQLRVPGQPPKHQSSPTLAWETEVEQVADASGGLEWDMWAPEPKPTQQPEFEVEYVPPTPEEATREKRIRKRNIAIGVVIPTLAVGAAIGVGIAVAKWEL